MLVRPEGRTLPNSVKSAFALHDVSMLVRPEGRTLPVQFNERVAPYRAVSMLVRPEGRTLRCRHKPDLSPVSMLVRPEGRTLRDHSQLTLDRVLRNGCFNARPPRRTDATIMFDDTTSARGFNARPPRRTDATSK